MKVKLGVLKICLFIKNFVCIYKEIARNVHWSINMALTNYSFGISSEKQEQRCVIDYINKRKLYEFGCSDWVD